MRLSNAGLAAYQCDLACTSFGSVPKGQKLAQFLVAADQP
jgi:hypothetical protein